MTYQSIWLLLAAFILSCASSASAQGFDFLLTPPKQAPLFKGSLSAKYEIPRSFENRRQNYDAFRFSATGRASLWDELPYSLNVFADFEDVDLGDSEKLLPDRLFSATVGFDGRYAFSRRFALYGQFGLNSAHDVEEISNANYSLRSMMLGMYRISDHWSIMPGVFLQTRSVDGSSPAIPYPILAGVYFPNPSFVLVFGFPVNGFKYDPFDWLSITYFNIAILNNSASVTAELDKEWSVNVSGSTVGDAFELTDEATFGEDSVIARRLVEAGVGVRYKPWQSTTISLDYKAQFQTKFEYRDDEGRLFFNPLRTDTGHAIQMGVELVFR